MSDFEATRDELRAAREQEAVARDERAAARIAVRVLEAQPEADPHVLQAAREELAQARDKYASSLQDATAALERFAPFSDPRRQLSKLGDDIPFLLMPLRIETRFKTVSDRRELWVRVFPDQFLIDQFEPVPSTTELANVRAYWRQVWRAGRDETRERAAWRTLVASHGSGRAGWLVDSYRPANEADRPTRTDPDEVILVISTGDPLSAAEQAALAAYWEARWRGDDVDPEDPLAGIEPFNLADEGTSVSVAFVVLPDPTAVKDQSWTRAPHVDLLPERLVLVVETGSARREILGAAIPSPLIVGPDPSAPPDEQLAQLDGDLELPAELRWMADFEEAVRIGLGFRVELSVEEATRGFDRLFVLGARLTGDPDVGQQELEQLLEHHRFGRAGLAIVPDGTPTNNTERAGSGYTTDDDADAAFDDRLRGAAFAPEPDPLLRGDGQRLAEALGVDPAAFADVRHADGLDRRDARAMQTALWPATLGYLLTTMLHDVVDPDDADHTRTFFTRYVSGRGAVNAVRVGDQPYGVLTTTAFSRLSWLKRRRDDFLERLWAMSQVVDDDWGAMADDVPFVAGESTDAHATLLGIVGLHPTSVEYHYRYAESLDVLFNKLNLGGLGHGFLEALIKAALDAPALQLLPRLGRRESGPVELLEKYFQGSQGRLRGPLIDDRPLSETELIRAWTTDKRSYLRWLVDAARTSLEAVRKEDGFIDDAPPSALLYLLARHAVQLGYADAGWRFYMAADLDASLREPAFIHVDQAAKVSESRFEPLYRREVKVTDNEHVTVAEHIAAQLPFAPDTRRLREQLRSLELLADASTARLERALAEHIDTVSYRFDAWRLGFVAMQLEQMRGTGAEDEAAKTGIHLGAYGWLLDVRPEPRRLRQVKLDHEQATVFARPNDAPLMHDPANGGYIHAPSPGQAVTAAVLRSGYLANASPDDPDLMAVNLSSERVRVALEILQGIRHGQSLAALLGYQLERGLHDRHDEAEVDVFIYALRRAFPLHALKLKRTATDPAVDDATIEQLEARNVVNGLALAEHVERTNNVSYPFGLTGLPAANAPQRAVIDDEVDRLRDARDAVADLALAEGVHQATQGNFDRASATLAAYSGGHTPPEPDVVRTPASGIPLTHRIGLHLRPGLEAGPTPRSAAEPALDDWLGRVLPAAANVGCRVNWKDPVSGTEASEPVTLDDLGLQPIDLLGLIRTADDQAMTELDDRIVAHVLATRAPRPDAALAIAYMDGGPGLSVFEAAPAIAHARALVSRARPLRPTDVQPPGAARERDDATARIDRARVAAVLTTAEDLATDITGYLTPLEPLVADPVMNQAALAAGVDDTLTGGVALLERGARLGVPGSGWGVAYEGRRRRYAELVARLREVTAAWTVRLDDVKDRLDAYDALPAGTPDDELLAEVARIESELLLVLEDPPATPLAGRARLTTIRDQFEARRDELLAIADGAIGDLSGLLAAVAALGSLEPYDAADLGVDAAEQDATRLVADVVAAVRALGDRLATRVTGGTDALAAHDAAADAPARLAAVQAGAEALLGEHFTLFPEFTVTPDHGAAWQDSLGEDLVRYLRDSAGRPFPVDEWLHGVARVRTPLAHLEQLTILAEAFGRDVPALDPAQLPHRPGERWLALEYPGAQVIDGERLLYTAIYAVPFEPGAAQCGSLLDEWTEVIPLPTASTGIAMHFDQPNCEAPQALLLVTPATWDGQWQWADLLEALPDTLRLARQRAVEPVQVDQTAYARFLPATITAVTLYGLSIALALAVNNDVHAQMAAHHG
jgi:hypothetical protein